MCGIFLLYGPRAKERLQEGLQRIKHRGPDDTGRYDHDLLSLGFNRLAINEKGAKGAQPFRFKNYISTMNGEIYNHESLKKKYGIDEIDGECDTQVVAPLFDILGSQLISDLDGFYSGIIYDEEKNELFCLRDYIGKKPLFVGLSQTEVFITSELKAVSDIQSFCIIPKGFSKINLITAEVEIQKSHQLIRLNRDGQSLKDSIEKAVLKRLPSKKEPLGIFLSGGLDSSIIASIVSKYRDDTIYYTLAEEGSDDYSYVKLLEKYLGLKQVKFIDSCKNDHLNSLIKKVVKSTESYNPSMISNGLCTYLLSEAANRDGLKVVLTGEGADELFCGYHFFRPQDPWKQTRQNLINDMHFTELRRSDLCAMAHSIEIRCPFLDREVFAIADGLNYHDFYRKSQGLLENKTILRKSFHSELPEEITYRRKKSFDVGSGVRKIIVRHLTKNGDTEKQVLKSIWHEFYQDDPGQKYYHSYPVFDSIIAKRGGEHK